MRVAVGALTAFELTAIDPYTELLRPATEEILARPPPRLKVGKSPLFATWTDDGRAT